MKLRLTIACCFLMALSLSGQKSKKSTSTAKKSESSELPNFNNLKWRNIGPFRGGRSVASTGVVGQPMTYYMGSTGGGLWKTEDDGINWKNISDGFFKTGTVGAVSVSESNPNIVLVGMGEHAARGVMTSMGDGIYLSTDAGKTWKHKGLDSSRHISDVIIDPLNPNTLFVAAQGAQYAPSAERGIYKSEDGGETWRNVLYVDSITGASSLTMDMNNPLVLYAAMWQHERRPWTIHSGGEKSGLYKSSDGGETWKKLKKGLPEHFGKAGISVSRANGSRVYAVIEAEGDKSGVYRSDDAGNSWKQVNKDRINITRSWYYMEIFADPQDENWVYVMNAPAMKSIDGGKTFTRISTPHGDNHHLWINPNDHMKMINSNDGGANVSNNGGKSWSTQQNQATSQFYRVITDNLTPYNVYGGQQDNSAISIKSSTNDGGIDWKDWHSVAGCESAFLAFDPDNPELIYGGCYQGIIGKYISSISEEKEIKAHPELSLGNQPKDFKYRFNWNAPIISSPHNRKTIYHAGNVVLRTTNEGQSWEAISPDLTKNEKDKQGPGGGPYTNEAAGGENYNTLSYMVESQHEEGVIWVGSDDGLVHLTKDGGKNWSNVTPKGMPDGIVNCIEVSPHDASTAYMVLMRYKSMDLSSYVYKTSDYGKTWNKIISGLDDPNGFARAIREDRKQAGLLYLGSETGMYISHNDGANWQKWQLNLPIVPINDLTIRNNDIVVATAGRSFWILDNISPIQNALLDSTKISLLEPEDTYRIFRGSSPSSRSGVGENPKQGVLIDYYLPEKMDSSEIELKFKWQDGTIVRTYTSKKVSSKSWDGGPSSDKILPKAKGFNRFVWDYSTQPVPGVDDIFVYGSYQGFSVPPGDYQAILTVDSIEYTQDFSILPNPSIEASEEDYLNQFTMSILIDTELEEVQNSVQEMQSVKRQLNTYKKLLEEHEDVDELIAQADSILSKIKSWEGNLVQEDQKTFQDVINFNNKLNAQLMNLKSYVNSPIPQVTKGAEDRLEELILEHQKLKEELRNIREVEMPLFNEMYKKANIPALIINEIDSRY